MSSIIEQDSSFGFAPKSAKPRLSGIGALQQAALRLADLRRGGTNAFKTMDLVNVLLCQAARTRRAALPPVRLHLRSESRNGVTAVRLRLY
ncbi:MULTISPECIES: hypothetical protein [Phyllobacterium]|mgnify:CR=1 FL=1|uniref:hypothetical protein n=1 Tax=Phyllobacterium TaxID=28100 RepID=UPI000E0F460F